METYKVSSTVRILTDDNTRITATKYKSEHRTKSKAEAIEKHKNLVQSVFPRTLVEVKGTKVDILG